jgi:cGMP-dependent protein kinase
VPLHFLEIVQLTIPSVFFLTVKRAAVMSEKNLVKDYVTKVVPKADTVKKLIYNAIKGNTLFKACSEEELHVLIDAFENVECKGGEVVIKQGDDGERFYVVEDGTLDITVRMEDGDSEGPNEVHVGVPYVPGSAFGELALMYGSPRAATIRAKKECKLWCIDRKTFRGITGQHKLKQAERNVEFLGKVKIGEKVLGDVLKASDLDTMSLALQKDTFRKGDVIVREGERGDIFYVIESGSVDVCKKESGDKPLTTLTTGQFFGERALLTEDVRQATCVATSEVQCLFLMREDFNLMLGNLQDLLDGTVRNDDDSIAKLKPRKDTEVVTPDKFELKDLEVLGILGIGAFGQVKLVKVRESVAVEESDSEPNDKGELAEAGSKGSKTYALKILPKSSIVESGLQDHVMTEKKIMEELNHPFILDFYGAMQDDKHIYFLLEVLLGGELFKFLRTETQFPESWSKFYAASVLIAFRDIHSKKIAYRDLKPENLVMDTNGYLKLVDFGLAKKINSGKTWTLCGTPDYLAPEVILNEGHDWAVDYWALGVLIYEMTAGAPPFYADDPMEVYENILSGNVSVPSHFSRGLCDIVKKLLRTYQSKRLGRTKGGTSAVMKHKWFSGFDWDALMNKTMPVPIQPKVKDTEDMSNFDSYPSDDQEVKACPEWNPEL